MEMKSPWGPDLSADLKRRIGKSPMELGNTQAGAKCPDIWELSNGDFAVIGRELTDSYSSRLPSGVSISPDDRLVVIPRNVLFSASEDL